MLLGEIALKNSHYNYYYYEEKSMTLPTIILRILSRQNHVLNIRQILNSMTKMAKKKRKVIYLILVLLQKAVLFHGCINIRANIMGIWNVSNRNMHRSRENTSIE